MADSESWTIGRLLQWTADFLKQRGADSPRLDAEVLLAAARDCERIELYTCFDEVADDTLREQFRGLVKQRAAGVPVAYLVGHKEFYSLPFAVTPDVLIPRPETEFLVVQLLDLAKSQEASELRILDVGTGSGILAVCAARYLPTARVVAVDISEPALAIAQQNAARHEVADRIEFLHSDLLSEIPSSHEPFHFIVSNPPYVSQQEYDQLDAGVRDHEPRQALLSGPTGDEVLRRLIDAAPPWLISGGHLLLEFSPMLAKDIQGYLTQQPEFTDVTLGEDLARLQRFATARRV